MLGASGLPDNSNFLWGNAAYFLSERITNAFALYSWTAAIRGVEGGGLVEGLPTHNFRTDEGDVALSAMPPRIDYSRYGINVIRAQPMQRDRAGRPLRQVRAFDMARAVALAWHSYREAEARGKLEAPSAALQAFAWPMFTKHEAPVHRLAHVLLDEAAIRAVCDERKVRPRAGSP